MRRIRLTFYLPLLGLITIASACGPFDDDFSEEAANRQGFENFETAVASDRNYDIYWLGREFEAGGLLYKGPDVADFGDDVEGGGLGMDYVAAVGDLKLVLYSRPHGNTFRKNGESALHRDSRPLQFRSPVGRLSFEQTTGLQERFPHGY